MNRVQHYDERSITPLSGGATSDPVSEGQKDRNFLSRKFSLKEAFRRMCSIGMLMPVLLVAQIIITVLIVWGLGFFNTMTSIKDITVQLEHEIASRINDTNVNSLQLPSKAINALRRDGLSGFWKTDDLRDSIFNHFCTFDEVSLLYIGIEDEFYSGFERLENGTVLEWSREAGNEAPALIHEVDAMTGERRPDWGPVMTRPYNTTLRPWYIGAITDHPKLYWTDVYPFAANVLGITLAGSVEIGGSGVVGVAAMDFTLVAISSILENVRLTENGIAFIVKKSGELLASNVKDDVELADQNLELIAAVDSSSNMISYASRQIIKDYGSFGNVVSSAVPRNIMSISKGLERYYVIASDFPFDKSIDWVIFVVIPESDIMENVFIVTGIIGGVTLLVVLVSIFVSIIFTVAITHPLRRLQKHMTDVSSMKFTDSTPRSFGLYEIKNIQSTFNGMVHALRSFRKFVPDAIVKSALQSGMEAGMKLDTAYISIFFLDIADFTTMAEIMHPDQLVLVIGEAMEALSIIVAEEGATIDKYIGDCIMALWNTPERIEDHEFLCCRAALLCQNKLKELHDGWVQRELPALEARIGIHCGQALVGNFGSSTRLNYTAIGDNVNLAARLEPLNKLYRTKILISDEMYAKVHKKVICRFVDRCIVKGKAKSTSLYEVVAISDTVDPQELRIHQQVERSMNKVAQLWNDNHMGEAISLIQANLLLPGYEDNYSMKLLEARFRRYQENPQEFVPAIHMFDKDF